LKKNCRRSLYKHCNLKKIAFALLLIASTAYGQAVRKYSNEFMNIGVDAASLGMSNAVVAHIDNVNSGYWNPAGLVRMEESEDTFMIESYFVNSELYVYAVNVIVNDDRSAYDVSIIRFWIVDILDTTNLIDIYGNIEYIRINLLCSAYYGVTFSYAL